MRRTFLKPARNVLMQGAHPEGIDRSQGFLSADLLNVS